MFIETEGTPNPATLKFLPGVDVMGVGTADFASPDAAARSQVARGPSERWSQPFALNVSPSR